jgi:hypothetical protein
MVSRLLVRAREEASMAENRDTTREDRDKARGSEEDIVDTSKDEFDDEDVDDADDADDEDVDEA